MNRIEEVLKEVWESGRDYSQVFDFQECLIREKWDERLFPQPLDDKELREKIARWYYYKISATRIPKEDIVAWERLNESAREFYRKDADQILALLQPKIEEAKAQAIELYMEQVLPLLLGSAIERERERVLGRVLEYLDARKDRHFVPSMIKWVHLALKGGE